MTAAAGYTERPMARPSDGPIAAGATVGPVLAKKGDALGTPSWQASLSAEYSWSLASGSRAYLFGAYQYTGDYNRTGSAGVYGYNSYTYNGKAVDTASLRVGLRQHGWDVSAYASNLFNTRVYTSFYQAQASGPDGARAETLRPRTLGSAPRCASDGPAGGHEGRPLAARFAEVMMSVRSGWILALGGWLACGSAQAIEVDASDVAVRVAAIETEVIAWRRDFHAHPELSNREFRTPRSSPSGCVLRPRGPHRHRHTGVIGMLRGGLPGPGGRPALRHGRPAGRRAAGPAVRVARRRASTSARSCR